ncbi:hypothetical protein ABGB18_41285 [Nonomuraea sp. B12E4]|uniref:hypothetical protein n=1 Tax=Nonomuraea sp. B12E4 TaxID=3153564 RepID=UPI00325EC321
MTDPAPGDVRVRVHSCGVCHTDAMAVEGLRADPISVATGELIFGTRSINGSLTGSSIENEDNLAFSLRHGIRPMTEVLPLSGARKAYEHMLSGDARFRVVLDMAT